MLDTATAVYEAIEPIVIWRSLFETLRTSLASDRLEVSLGSAQGLN